MELFPLMSGNLGLTPQNSWWQKCCLSVELLVGCESCAWHCLQPFVLLSSCQPHMHWPTCKCGSPSRKCSQGNSTKKSSLTDLKLGHQVLSALWLRNRQITTRPLWPMEPFPSLLYTISIIFSQTYQVAPETRQTICTQFSYYKSVFCWCFRQVPSASWVYFWADLLFCQKFCFSGYLEKW